MYSHNSEPVRFERDCDVIMVPAGDALSLPAGTVGYLTQSMGGSFTVFVEGNLFRISGRDADAIGKESPPAPELPAGASDEDFESLVWQQIATCYDPEIPVNIVELGLIYDVKVVAESEDRRSVEVFMTLTAPGCGMGEILVDDVRDKVEMIPTVGTVIVELVFDPPWNATMMSDAARLETGFY
jgi:probable FeS assembly SUF system protein SufT